jgi:large subunit ribosomal protein L25
MDRLSLKAEERTILGKKVKSLRKNGFIPGHVFGNGVETEHVSVNGHDFLKIYDQAGETGLIDLKIGEEKVRPVMVRGVQYDPVSDNVLNIDFYQVNLKEKVTVPVPIVTIGEEPESVHLGETVILQPISEVEVEALPTDLVEHIEVDITGLKEIGDAITVGDLKYDREKLTVLAEPEEVVVKLDTAVTEEMKKLMEEQAAELEAAQTEAEEAEAAEGEAPSVEGEEGGSAEGEEAAGGEEGSQLNQTEDKPNE